MFMGTVVELVKAYLLPGSALFLMLGLTIGVVLLYARRSRQQWGRTWLAGLAVFYWVISTPLAAGWMERVLGAGYGPIADAAQAQGATAIVVLGGGSATFRSGGEENNVLSESSCLRVLESARVYRLLEAPWVFASGGKAEGLISPEPESLPLDQALLEAGVPEARLVLESASQDTREQALALVPLLQARGVDRFVLVTSPLHMRRALGAFRAVGLHPIPSASAQHSETSSAAQRRLLPNENALHASQMAFREMLALGYYAVRGWLAGP
jgi:uncharacterized SAM-binding protein YcdF (DUF218 family)